MTTPTPQAIPRIYPISCNSLSPTISRWVPLRAIDIHSLRSLGMFDNGKPIYHHLNHPIKWVRVTGVVVAIDEFNERRILTLDDSSGSCIECVCATPPSSVASTSSTVPEHLNQFKVKITSAQGASSKSESKAGQANGKKAFLGGRDRDGKVDATENQPSTQNPLVPWENVDVGSVLKTKGQLTRFRDMMQVDVIKIDIIGSTELEVKCWEEVLAFRRVVLSKPWVVSVEEGKRCEEKARRRERDTKKRKHDDVRRKEDGRLTGVQRSAQSGGTETEEERRRRHDLKKCKMGNEKERETDGLDPAKKINYPSMAVTKRVPGKYKH